MKTFKSVKEKAIEWQISERQVRNLCMSGKIDGAIKIGSTYVIPTNAKRPSKRKNKDRKEINSLKYNYVIIHGTFGNPSENWFPWLAREIADLDKSGNTSVEDILIPHFPSSRSSDYDSWKSILMGYIDSGIINHNTIFICHSLGPLFISRVLIEEKIRVKGMISVEGAANHYTGNEDFDRINSTFFVPSWDYLDQVKKYIDFNYCFYSDNDPYIPFNVLKKYVQHASTRSFLVEGAGHFNESSGYTEFPQLLKLIIQIENNDNIQSENMKDYKWDKNLSHTWTNMTWPNRPSVCELSIYTKYLREYQNNHDNIKCLILGSNVEFRDWAYEENLDVSIMHNNPEYHLATYRELRHKNAPYTLILNDWKEINFFLEYDLIVGDQLIGNVSRENFEDFIKRVAKSLKKDGLFLSKSYYVSKNYRKKTDKEIFNDYYKNGNGLNPLAYCIYDLSITCMDNNNYLNFNRLNTFINNAYKKKLITDETYEYLSSVGLEQMNFDFFIPFVDDYERTVSKYFDIVDKLYTDDVGGNNFPIYILRKR